MRRFFDEALRVDSGEVPAGRVIALSAALFVLIAVVDWLTSYELSLDPLYLVLVVFVTWRAGWRWGLVFALASVVNQTANGLLTGYPFSKPAYFFVVNFNKLFAALVIVALMERVRATHERERVLARLDFLTGVLNYKGFHEALAREMERHRRKGKTFSVAFIDCDNLKELNDRFGHAAGDEALGAIARRLRAHMRATDVVARLGGDEFALLVADTDTSTIEGVIRRLHEDLGGQFRRDDYRLTLSIGVASFNEVPKSEDEVLSIAARLISRGKARGKDFVVYETAFSFPTPD